MSTSVSGVKMLRYLIRCLGDPRWNSEGREGSNIILIGVLRSAIHGDVNPEVTVDKWPDVDSLVIKFNPEMSPNVPRFLQETVFVATRDSHSLAALLDRPGTLDWTKKIRLNGCSKDALDVIKTMIEERNLGALSPEELTPWTLFKFTQGTVAGRALPPGYYWKSLTVDQAPMINDCFAFREGQLTENYIRFHLNLYPSMCVYNPCGHPVAWALMWITGTSGCAWVVPEERGKGCGGHVGALLTQEMYKLGMSVFGYVSTENSYSLTSLKRSGHTAIPGDIYFALYRPHTPPAQTRPNGNYQHLSKL